MTLPLRGLNTFLTAGRAAYTVAAYTVTGLIVPLFLLATTALAQPADQAIQDQFEQALTQFNNNLFAGAARSFHTLRSSWPDHVIAPEAMYYEAESYLALGREEEAIALLTRFDEQHPRHRFAFGTRLALGAYFFEQAAFEQALRTLGQVLEGSPTPDQASRALYWMAESAFNLDRPDEGLGYLERIIVEHAQTEVAAKAAYAVAYRLVALERMEAAATAFERLDRQFGSSTHARDMGLALAEVYYAIGDFARASEDIERRLPNVTGSTRDRAMFLLAESQNQLRRSDQAIISYRYFTEGDPSSPYYARALYGLAWNYHHEGAWQWAADTFARVIDEEDTVLAASAAYYRAVNLRRAEDLPGAVDAYRAYLRSYPDHRLADRGQLELGITLYELRQWQRARDAFAELVETYPDSDVAGEAWKHLGNTEIALGNFDAAHEAFDAAIAAGTADPSLAMEIIFQRAWLNYRTARYTEAAEQFMALFKQQEGIEAGEALFWAAESNFQRGDYAAAERLFTDYIADFPAGQHAEAAQYALGWTYFRQGQYAAAVPRFEQFLDSFRDETGTIPYRSDARLRLADSYFALKEYPAAVRVYGGMAAAGDDYALYQIGQAYSNTGDAFEAMSTFNDLLAEYPASEWREEARYQLGYLFFMNQEYEQAIREYETLIASFPLDPLAAKAQYGKGDAYFNAGNSAAAVREYQTVLTDYADSPFVADAAAGIQFALMADGQNDRADALVDSLATALEGTPAADQLRFRQAEAKYQAGLVDAAMLDFQQFLEQATTSDLMGHAHYYLAEGHMSRGETEQAMAAYRIVAERYPDSPRQVASAGALGHLLLSAGNIEEAERFFRLMEDSAGDDVRARAEGRYGLSLVLARQGRTDEAEELLRQTVSDIPPGDATYPAWLGLARIAESNGDLTEAMRLFDMVASQARDETGAEALFLLGKIHLDAGRLDEGIETLSRMQALFAGYPVWVARSLLTQASAFEQQGEVGQAITLYETIETMYPDTNEAMTASERLEVLRG